MATAETRIAKITATTIKAKLVKLGTATKLCECFPDPDSVVVHSVPVPTPMARVVGELLTDELTLMFTTWDQSFDGADNNVYDLSWDFIVDMEDGDGRMTPVRAYFTPRLHHNMDSVGR